MASTTTLDQLQSYQPNEVTPPIVRGHTLRQQPEPLEAQPCADRTSQIPQPNLNAPERRRGANHELTHEGRSSEAGLSPKGLLGIIDTSTLAAASLYG